MLLCQTQGPVTVCPEMIYALLQLRKYTLATTAIVPVSSDIKGNLQIFISSTEPNLTSANFSVAGNELVNGKFALKRNLVARVSKSLDWKEQGSKFTYKLEVTPDQLVISQCKKASVNWQIVYSRFLEFVRKEYRN